jgi:hypothetical protein
VILGSCWIGGQRIWVDRFRWIYVFVRQQPWPKVELSAKLLNASEYRLPVPSVSANALALAAIWLHAGLVAIASRFYCPPPKAIASRLAAKADWTVRALSTDLKAAGINVSHDTVWRFLRRQGLTFKKNFTGQRDRSAQPRAPADAVANLPEQD